MTPHLKLIQHDPARGKRGDCYRTCIASLLDVHPSAVPNTCGDKDSTRRYLAKKGYLLVEIPVYGPELVDVLCAVGAENPNAFYLVLGTSRNGIGHCVVARGHEMIHDPNPDKPGLVSGLEDEMFFVQFIVPLAMTQVQEQPRLRQVAE